MKQYLIPFLVLIGFSTQAQTKMIGHKSHSGAKVNFNINMEGNFGEYIPPPVKIIQKLSDSVFIFTYDSTYYIKRDTMRYHFAPQKLFFKKEYPKATFLGFHVKKKHKEGGAMIHAREPEKEASYLLYILTAFASFIGFFTWKTNDKT